MIQRISDPVIDEIREIRQKISARFDHDPARLVAYYRALHELYRAKRTERPQSAERNDESAA